MDGPYDDNWMMKKLDNGRSLKRAETKRYPVTRNPLVISSRGKKTEILGGGQSKRSFLSSGKHLQDF